MDAAALRDYATGGAAGTAVGLLIAYLLWWP